MTLLVWNSGVLIINFCARLRASALLPAAMYAFSMRDLDSEFNRSRPPVNKSDKSSITLVASLKSDGEYVIVP